MSTEKPIPFVVLIDDSDVDNYIHRRVLLRSELVGTVIEFESAIDALAFFKSGEQSVSLVLLDINMPRMNGFEFLEQYNALDESLRAEVVIFMLTSSEHSDDRTRAQGLGVGFASKPLTLAGVKSIAAEHFGLEPT